MENRTISPAVWVVEETMVSNEYLWRGWNVSRMKCLTDEMSPDEMSPDEMSQTYADEMSRGWNVSFPFQQLILIRPTLIAKVSKEACLNCQNATIGGPFEVLISKVLSCVSNLLTNWKTLLPILHSQLFFNLLCIICICSTILACHPAGQCTPCNS